MFPKDMKNCGDKERTEIYYSLFRTLTIPTARIEIKTQNGLHYFKTRDAPMRDGRTCVESIVHATDGRERCYIYYYYCCLVNGVSDKIRVSARSQLAEIA